MNIKYHPQGSVKKILSRKKLKGLRVKLLSEYDVDVIDGIYYSACEAESKINKKSASVFDSLECDRSISSSERNELELFLSDDIFEAELIRQASEEVVVIALYKTVEIATKKMLASSGLFSEREVRSFFRIKNLKELAGQKVTNLETIPGFYSYDELRCLNNCIKHSGTVDSELSNYSGWVKGEKLDKIWQHYRRLKPGVREFMTSLSRKIIEKM